MPLIAACIWNLSTTVVEQIIKGGLDFLKQNTSQVPGSLES